MPIKGIPKGSSWIDVKQVLPPSGVRVLACTHVGWLFIGKDFALGDEIHDGPNGVACWMPLPEPPKEVQHG